VVVVASSGVANATISFCSLIVKVAIIVLLGATLSAVMTSITPNYLKSKVIMREIDTGEDLAMMCGSAGKLSQVESDARPG